VARLTRFGSVLALLAVSSVALSSCGSGGAIADARHSCVYVTKALSIERQSQQPGLTTSRRNNLEASALSELLKGTPYAAAATSADGSWNPLMTAINEAERVPIPDLKDTLSRLCRIADSQTPYV
jgi:hypothetical protein